MCGIIFVRRVLRHNNEGGGLVVWEEGGDEEAIAVQLQHDFKLLHEGDDLCCAGLCPSEDLVQIEMTDDPYKRKHMSRSRPMRTTLCHVIDNMFR